MSRLTYSACCREAAFAKINLFLEVTAKREDGYHEIDTVMQTVSLADGVSVSVTPLDADCPRITLDCTAPWIPKDHRNTAYRAAELFLAEIGETAAVDIQIAKTIPSAAGLGGGSSDAAAVLRALNRIYKQPLDLPALCAIGKKIGADVPFCIRGGAVRCRGIGELFDPCINLSPCSVVIAIGRQRSQTPAAYGLLDAAGYRGNRSAEEIALLLSEGRLQAICDRMYNAFEEVILPTNRDAAALREIFSRNNCMGSLMSGSGAAVFAILRSRKQADALAASLRRSGYRAWSAYPVRSMQK